MPKHIPAFVRVDVLNNHNFSIDGDEYEFVEGQFFKKVSTLRTGDSFGQAELQFKCSQKTNIKSESACEFACLTKEGYENSLKGIREQIEKKMVQFLSSVSILKELT